MLIDTHCHLDFEDFEKDFSQVLEKAEKNRVNFIIDPGIDYPSSQNAIKLAQKYSQIYAAVGLHPNSSTQWRSGDFERYLELAKHKKVVAVGEIGLDYYRDRAPHDVQKEVFLQQLEIANLVDKPVIIHTRDSINDTLNILEKWVKNKKSKKTGVLHSFSGDYYQAMRAIELGFKVGITGPITFKNAQELRATVSRLSLDNILIETDSPFLTPHPYRGKRNEPAYVMYVAEKLAEVFGVAPITVQEKTTQNARELFGI